ncbi:D-alanyl-D-alanine carboxypeptidase/D-alanyl-D-alanine endopeptidase [Actinomadura parmotrematis]|uniref:D-alanyl-D-alanine carboxypeptidase/D-alanyl-D-alanine-endopeptidase n=1 Tax=Actinomadura parmotrematis TaxID=2864039 RepID=A0ABS7G4W6_9ACTN|nr:D-alanyl-D-alanine carboxypeptidase/D-alanyl-D-alanine-endopeptidase [Actinomadura parmotrematis]MBW8487738.1 D-alanyl-D-alanine carboxypeptidase/D-alanyl-D-alanine-endopeptidase [Actinomadura parmotrematis]
MRARILALITLSLLNLFSVAAGLAVAKLTPDRHLSPQPPTVAERDSVRTASPLAAASGGREPAAAALAARLNGLLTGDTGGRTNAVVIDALTRRTLFQQRGDQPATPASTTKLATSVAALAALGPDHRIATRVVQGSGSAIVLVGGGDPTLTARPAQAGAAHPPYASLADLAAQTAKALKAAGVKRTRVDYDVSAYAGPRTAYGWKDNYLPDGELAPVSALTVDEGRVSPDDPSVNSRVDDPPAAATEQFAKLLTHEGIAARAGRRTTAPQDAARLGQVQSPTLAALIEHLLTESDNDVAEAVARQVAIGKGAPASFAGAAQAVTGVLASLGVGQGIAVNDGSGLSALNRITPAALARVVSLAASDQHPELRAAITGMPVAGFSGTLQNRYATSESVAGAGLVRAKTGTLAGVSTLAGLAYDADGRLLAFAFMAGDGKSAVDPHKLDELAAAVASCGCR